MTIRIFTKTWWTSEGIPPNMRDRNWSKNWKTAHSSLKLTRNRLEWLRRWTRWLHRTRFFTKSKPNRKREPRNYWEIKNPKNSKNALLPPLLTLKRNLWIFYQVLRTRSSSQVSRTRKWRQEPSWMMITLQDRLCWAPGRCGAQEIHRIRPRWKRAWPNRSTSLTSSFQIL